MATTTIFQSRDMPTVVRKNAKALRSMEDDVTTLQTDVTAAETAITGLDSPAGTATLLQGNTSVTVTHSWGATSYVVSAVPQADLGSGRRYWVSGKSATQFDINIDTSVVGNRVFEWILRSTA